VAIGDLNGDGKADLVTANFSSSTVSLLSACQQLSRSNQTGFRLNFELAPPHPNPFRSQATLDLSIPRPAFVRLEIYDVQGRRIRTLQNGLLRRSVRALLGRGDYERIGGGDGVYFVRFSASG